MCIVSIVGMSRKFGKKILASFSLLAELGSGRRQSDLKQEMCGLHLSPIFAHDPFRRAFNVRFLCDPQTTHPILSKTLQSGSPATVF